MSKARLPNAPLVEVVFEMRWALQGEPNALPFLSTDPGFFHLIKTFPVRADRLGFPDQRKAGEQIPYSVVARFYPAPDRNFPLLQIGPGIFAVNQSAEYEWRAFKKQVIAATRALLVSYPVLPNASLAPTRLELRYIDVMNQSLSGATDLVSFINANTTMRIVLPGYLQEKSVFAGEFDGRVLIQRPLKKWKSSIFAADIASGSTSGNTIVRLESKVITDGKGIPPLRKATPFLKDLDRWLEFARGVTSPFFKDYVTPALMNKFAARK